MNDHLDDDDDLADTADAADAADMCDWDAAWLTNALSPTQRRAYEAHLATCVRCTEAVAELAPVMVALRQVPADRAMALVADPDVGGAADHVDAGATVTGPAADRPAATGTVADPRDPPVAPPGVLEGVVARLRRARRRRRLRFGLAVAGAAVAGALGIVAVGAVLDGSVPAPVVAVDVHEVAMEAASPDPMLLVEASLTETAFGTVVDLECAYRLDHPDFDPADSFTYSLYVRDRAGAETMVATWVGTGGHTATPSGTTAIPMADIEALEVRMEPAGVLLFEGTPST